MSYTCNCRTKAKIRTRMCNNPSPSNGGNFCFGYSAESSGCDCIGNVQIYVVVKNLIIITF